MLILFSQFTETNMGFIYTHKEKKAFILKPFKFGKYFARVEPETSSVFIEMLNTALENTKGYAIFVYPETRLKVDHIKYYGNIVENIPEGVHYVEIPGYVKGNFIFKDYDMIVFLVSKRKKEIRVEMKTYETSGVILGLDEEAISQGAGLICGATGCVLGSVVGFFIFPMGCGGCIGGAVGAYLGYEGCKNVVKTCVK